MFFVDLLEGLLMSALVLDILYLYFAGGWIEPNTVIRITELVLLVVIAIWGIARTVQRVKNLVDKGDLK